MECRAGFVVVFLEVIPLKISVVGNPSATKKDQESKKSRPEGNENKSRLAEAYIFRQKNPPSLKLTAILHLKMDVWNKSFLLDPFGMAYFHKFVGVQRALG